jgi:antitoxin (DNA-binding transcriptional repressor) of toxin-antitoxin stability system
MTVRDIRLRWPEAERKLAAAGEVIVTRDSKPIARILPYEQPRIRRRDRFDSRAHAAWLRRVWKGKRHRVSTDEWLDRDRAE